MQNTELSRRDAIKRMVAGTGGVALGSMFVTKARADEAGEDTPAIEFTPDFKVRIRGEEIEVDIDLLADDGELTAGFVASLDTHHGDSWRTMPDPDSTSPARILQLVAHMEEHGMSASQVFRIYQLARAEWVKKYQPEEAPEPAPAEGHDHDH